jgi:hypothetical protein
MTQPDRVVVTNAGYAVSVKEAWQNWGVRADIVFHRADGWSLGAPSWLEEVAYKLWPDQWLTFERKGELPKPVGQYKAEVKP